MEAFIVFKEETADLRSLTLEERGHRILSVCRTAAEIQRSRIKSGLAPVTPVPWPSSTLKMLRKYAQNATPFK